jgi:hypothetical protein
MDDDIPPTQVALSQTPTQVLSPTPGYATPAPAPQRRARRPLKALNHTPLYPTPEMTALDARLTQTFGELSDLIYEGIETAGNNQTDGQLFYARLQEFKEDFDSLIILRQGGRKKKTKKRSKFRSRS